MNYDKYINLGVKVACPICRKNGVVEALEDIPELREAHCPTHGVIVSDSPDRVAMAFAIA